MTVVIEPLNGVYYHAGKMSDLSFGRVQAAPMHGLYSVTINTIIKKKKVLLYFYWQGNVIVALT